MLHAVFSALLVLPPQGPAAVVEPTDYVSPSGRHVLHVDPGTRAGAGPARYRLLRDGQEQWAATLPFTLRQAAVNETGFAVGYAFTEGDVPRGELVVAILSPAGEVLLDDRTPRMWSRVMHAPPVPDALALIPDFEHDRFAVHIRDEINDRGVEVWRRYRIAAGERVEDLRPAAEMNVGDRVLLRLSAARAVPGTDLHLLHWWRVDLDDRSRGYFPDGAVFTLMAPDGGMVWEHQCPTDYTVDGDQQADDALAKLVQSHGVILETARPGRFALWIVADGEKVTWQAEPRPGGWQVREQAREPFSPTVKSIPVPAPIELVSLGAVALQTTGAAPAVRNVRAWSFAPGGRGFQAIRHDSEWAYTLVDVDEVGKVTGERPFALPEGTAGTIRWHSLGGASWLVVVQQRAADPKAFLVDATTGHVEPWSGLTVPREGGATANLAKVTSLPAGRLVALGTFRFQHTMQDGLFGFAPDGKLQWSVGKKHGDPTMLFGAKDVTVTTTGLVVVLENVSKTLKVFDADGRHVRTVDLVQTLGREPNYLADISPGPDGSILVHDFRGTPPLLHVAIDGRVIGEFTPRFRDGRTPDVLARNARFAPDGELWTFDGFVFLRLGADGVVAEPAAAPPSGDAITEPGTSAIAGGCVCIQDRRTGALHVWAESGERVLVGDTEPADAEQADPIGRIAAAPDGSLWVGHGGFRIERRDLGYLGWDRTGRRLGHLPCAGDVAFAPDGERLWNWGREAGLIQRNTSGELLSRIDRMPDDRWFPTVADVVFEANGGMAVLSPPWVSFFPAARAGRRMLSIEGSAPDVRRLHCSADWLLLSSWKPVVVLVQRSSGELFTFTPEAAAGESSWAHGISLDGKRLLSLEVRSGRLHRFALP